MRHCTSALCLTLLSALAAGSMAQAADLQQEPGSSPSFSSKDWSGAYLGLQGGRYSSTGGTKLDSHSGALIPLDVQNGLFIKNKEALRGTITGGVTAGYNHQLTDLFVVGIEADVTPMTLSVKHSRSRIDPNPAFPFTGQETNSHYETTFDRFGSLRLRGGLSFGKTLVYLTGGLAMADTKNSFDISIPGLGYNSPDWSKSGMLYGYAIGGGIEHKLGEKISVKMEGLMVDLQDRVVNGRDPANFPGEQISYKFDNKMMIARVGINYAF